MKSFLISMLLIFGNALLQVQAASGPQPPLPVTIAIPGPGALPMLPVELIPLIGADKEEGIKLTIRHFGGGPLAIKDMLGGNSEFAAMGFSALVETKDIKGKAYSVASMVQVPAYTLMVSVNLKDKVQTLQNLRGRTIGVHSGSRSGKSTGQHIVEFLLKKAGVSPQEVNFVNAGQDYKSYSATLMSGAADAIITNEPSATRLEQSGRAYALVNLHTPSTTKYYFGNLFQYVQLASRKDIIDQQTDKVNRMVAALIRALRWIEKHSPEEIVALIKVQSDEEREVLKSVLAKNKAMFSPDGVFSEDQLKGTHMLMKAISGGHTPHLDDFIDAQWVGRRP